MHMVLALSIHLLLVVCVHVPSCLQAKPAVSLDSPRAQALMARIQDAGTEVVNAKVRAGAGDGLPRWLAGGWRGMHFSS
jgi:hypothetical protein